jgi:hypothetical protein
MKNSIIKPIFQVQHNEPIENSPLTDYRLLFDQIYCAAVQTKHTLSMNEIPRSVDVNGLHVAMKKDLRQLLSDVRHDSDGKVMWILHICTVDERRCACGRMNGRREIAVHVNFVASDSSIMHDVPVNDDARIA